MAEPFTEAHAELLWAAEQMFPIADSLPRFELPGTLGERLREAHEQAQRLTSLTVEGGARRDWLTPLRNGLGHVEQGLTASHYHLERAEGWEDLAIDTFRGRLPVVEHAGSTGGTFSFSLPQLTFEYQAFVFALRRTLEYLAGATAAFFKRDGNRVKDLAKIVNGAEPLERSDAVRDRVSEALPALGLSSGHERSVRDRLAHYEAIDAGTFNVWWDPAGKVTVGLAGGGEELWFDGVDLPLPTETRLTSVLKRQLRDVEDLVVGVCCDLGLVGDDGDAGGQEVGKRTP